jgi:sortase A
MLGIGLFAYPYVAAHLSNRNSSQAIQEYAEAISAIDQATIDSELAKAHRYNDELAGDPVYDPFVAGSGTVRGQDYAGILSIDHMMGYIDIPKIDVHLPLYHGTADETLQTGIGHLEGTSFPVGGSRTHAVLTGHSGLTTARIFTDLIELKDNDIFYVRILTETLAYQVNQVKVVEPTDTTDLDLIEGKDYITLITCTPYGVNSHRLLVRGERIDYVPGMEEDPVEKQRPSTEGRILFCAGIPTALLMSFLILFAVFVRKRKGDRQKKQLLESVMQHSRQEASIHRQSEFLEPPQSAQWLSGQQAPRLTSKEIRHIRQSLDDDACEHDDDEVCWWDEE